ncbi:MAG: DNA-binding protein [Proteobacteria bacterium]|nr:DNA-binding protein [Pseudomonadota bacterium]
MKKYLIIMLSLILLACASEKYGAGVDKNVQKVSVKDVVLNPAFQGKTVNLEGKITTQCASNGCWFFLNDGSGQIFIDLATNGFAIPPKQGKKAKVTGVVSFGQAGVYIIAIGVEIG